MRRRELATLGVVALAGCVSEATELANRVTGRRETKKRIVEEYETGINRYNEGVRTVEVAVSHEDWSVKKRQLAPGLDQFRAATERFEAARRRARAIDHQEATKVCSMGVEKSKTMVELAQTGVEAAEAFGDEEHERGDQLWQEFKRLRRKANGMELPPTRALARVLGLSE